MTFMEAPNICDNSTRNMPLFFSQKILARACHARRGRAAASGSVGRGSDSVDSGSSRYGSAGRGASGCSCSRSRSRSCSFSRACSWSIERPGLLLGGGVEGIVFSLLFFSFLCACSCSCLVLSSSIESIPAIQEKKKGQEKKRKESGLKKKREAHDERWD